MAKVSVTRCQSYRLEEVYPAVNRAVGLIGGLTEVVKPGDTVLLKLNLLSVLSPRGNSVEALLADRATTEKIGIPYSWVSSTDKLIRFILDDERR